MVDLLQLKYLIVRVRRWPQKVGPLAVKEA
jgi:hypothetical protein